ncbi:MAG: hypothetical protein ACRDKF_16810, partial [Actinomycetota bacterium]
AAGAGPGLHLPRLRRPLVPAGPSHQALDPRARSHRSRQHGAHCGFHHRLVHEHCWEVRLEPNGAATWLRPDGSAFTPGVPVPEELPARAYRKSSSSPARYPRFY